MEGHMSVFLSEFLYFCLSSRKSLITVDMDYMYLDEIFRTTTTLFKGMHFSSKMHICLISTSTKKKYLKNASTIFLKFNMIVDV
jgi:hypothetical protein